MVEVERLEHFPIRYGQYFADVVEYYEGRGRNGFEWGYGKTDRYRVSFIRDQGGLALTLASIRYDGDWKPYYTEVYSVVEAADDERHFLFEFADDQVPHAARTTPELVLRGILHNVQAGIQLRKRNRVE